MSRIKLPGSTKVKKVILAILVIISIGVIVKSAIDNKQYEDNKNKLLQEKEDEDRRLAKEIQEIEETNKEVEKTKGETEKETQLYDDAFNTFHSGEYGKTIGQADLIIKEFPNSFKAYNIRGIAKAFNGSFQEGMKDIDKSLELKSDYGYARFNKALNYELNKDYNNALVWYDKALEVEQYLWSYYGKASIYGRLGDVKNTSFNLEKALEIAKKENVEEQVKEEAKKESDFNIVRESEEFQKLVY